MAELWPAVSTNEFCEALLTSSETESRRPEPQLLVAPASRRFFDQPADSMNRVKCRRYTTSWSAMLSASSKAAKPWSISFSVTISGGAITKWLIQACR